MLCHLSSVSVICVLSGTFFLWLFFFFVSGLSLAAGAAPVEAAGSLLGQRPVVGVVGRGVAKQLQKSGTRGASEQVDLGANTRATTGIYYGASNTQKHFSLHEVILQQNSVRQLVTFAHAEFCKNSPVTLAS